MLFPDIFSKDFQRYERVHISESTIAIVLTILIKRLFITSQLGLRLLTTDAQQIFFYFQIDGSKIHGIYVVNDDANF